MSAFVHVVLEVEVHPLLADEIFEVFLLLDFHPGFDGGFFDHLEVFIPFLLGVFLELF